jgi:uncharacterized protein (TIGR00725 family)
MRIKRVGFFGGAAAPFESGEYRDAFAVAKKIAESDRWVVNGGGPGIMQAATDGARAAGGKVAVVYYRPELATNFMGEVAMNVGDETFEEANYIDRTQRLLQMSDASIVFNGGTGTLSEFAMAWGIARLYIDHHKPLLLFGGFWYPIMEALATGMRVRPDELRAYKIVTSPDEAIRALEIYEETLSAQGHDHVECVGPECSLML